MGENHCTENCHKMLIDIDESTGLCLVCQDRDLFLVLYTYDKKILLIDEPTWQGQTIDNKSH